MTPEPTDSRVATMRAELRVAAIRQAVRRAGRRTGSLRRVVLAPFWLLCIGLGVLSLEGHHGPMLLLGSWFGQLAALCARVAIPLAAGYRLVQQRRLARAMQALSPEQRAQALLPVYGDEDTYKIARGLLRECRVAEEVTPAEPSAGPNQEVCAADTEVSST